ncbi:hypothetical protein EV44_g3756 [Erysiphe necator]|uniref:CCHC-type domain-containing protein n=1 Tax=Uncinula necator TaxID=52586 RepID=A0A0B1P8T8_UNCNE|nr:hypothetical protein EV44_g3756 [Erysiphe necator]
MQVAMIQSMLPYVAWPVRVSLEMDEDFTSARRTIKQNSLGWAGTVGVILTILLKHNALGSPLSNLARLAVTPGESSLQFSRKLRKLIFALPSDVLLREQAREVIQQHVRQFLPRTWTYIQQHTSSLPNDELADRIVQITEETGRWFLEDKLYQPVTPSHFPHQTISSIDSPSTSHHNPLQNEIFTTHQNNSDSQDEQAFISKSVTCYKCGKQGHYANNCKLYDSHSSKPPHNSYPKTKRFSNKLRDRYVALKKRGFGKNQTYKPNQQSRKEVSFVSAQYNDDVNSKSTVDQLDNDEIDDEIESFLEECLIDENDE